MKKNKITDGVTILHKHFIKGDPARLAAIEAEREKIKIAEQIYTLRQERKLTQKELADIVGTTQSVISRLENTDYENERIETLQKLAVALQCHLEVRFVPEAKLPSMTEHNISGPCQVSEDYTWNKGGRLNQTWWNSQECNLQTSTLQMA